VSFRHLWGREKRSELLTEAQQRSSPKYDIIHPSLGLGLPFYETTVGTEYLVWPTLEQLFPVLFPGVKTSRDDVVTDIDRNALANRMKTYFEPTLSNTEVAIRIPSAMESTKRFDANKTREILLKKGYSETVIHRFCYRPFDLRWLYWESETKLLDEKRSEYVPHVVPGNLWIEARQKQSMEAFDVVTSRPF
jgi:hypothetical protein